MKEKLLLVQGDVVLYEREGPMPEGETEKVFVLAEGEQTGHAHRLNAPVMAVMINGSRFFETDAELSLTHEEHGTDTIPANTVIRQIPAKEYDHWREEAREVQD